MEPLRTQRGQAAERFLTTENTEQHGKEIRMHFRFCVLPCFPWLPVSDDRSCQGNMGPSTFWWIGPATFSNPGNVHGPRWPHDAGKEVGQAGKPDLPCVSFVAG